MTKKQILTGGVAAVLLLASATVALAQTASTTATTTVSTTATTTTPTPTPTATTTTPTPAPAPTPVPVPSPTPVPMPMPTMNKDMKNVVQIGPEGNATLRGTVSAIGTNSITVSSWGGVWTIVIGADTEIMPKGTTTSLGMIKQGDFVGVNGKVDTTQAWTINAKTVRDVDAEQAMTTMMQQMRMRLKQAQEDTRGKIKQIKQTSKNEIKRQQENVKDLRKQLIPTRKPGQKATTTQSGQNSQ